MDALSGYPTSQIKKLPSFAISRRIGDMQLFYPDEFVETLPREALRQIQLRKFQLMLDKVMRQNAFYQKKLRSSGIKSPADIRDFDDYQKIPFLLKSELAADQAATPPYGTNLTYLKDLITYWHDHYDWRSQEAKLNRFQQYLVPLADIDLHFRLQF